MIRARPQVAQGSATTVLLFENLHRFMGSVELIQAIASQAITGKHDRAFIVVLELGDLLGSLVGQSESNVRAARVIGSLLT